MGDLAYLLPILACPIMMGLMMWMMRSKDKPAPPPDGNTQEDIAVLRAEIATLRAQQNRPAEGGADQGARP